MARCTSANPRGQSGDGKIYRVDGSAAVPVFSVRLSEVDGFWAGDFAYDSQGTLWLSSGNTRPANLYKITNGKPNRVFSSADSIAGIAFAADGSLVYTDWGHSIYMAYTACAFRGTALSVGDQYLVVRRCSGAALKL
jgi:hypothetical protein